MKPALRQVATVTRIVDGKTITGPAHWFGLPRIKASDITRHGSLDAARDELSRRAASVPPERAPTSNIAVEARGGKDKS